MNGDVQGVRIIPPIVEFRDKALNVLHKINITVKNVSKSSKEIRYWHPQSKDFKLKVKNPEKPVAPGLEVAAVVEYETSEAVERKDRIVVTVDGEVIEVPIKAYPAQPNLVLEGPVDFGNVVANSKVIAKEIMLYNHGSKAGEFKLKYSGEKPISVIPSSGEVPPNSAQIVKIEYVTKQPGRFDEVAKIKLEGQESSLLEIRGNIVEGGLELLSHSNEQQMECVKFGATLYGTDKTQSAILYNNGPDPVCFVAVLNEDAVGQEFGSTDPEGSLNGGEMNGLTSLVTALPNQGMLGPYEKIPIFFRFSPRWNEAQQGFNCTKEAPPRQDFALFMQLKVVGASSGFNNDTQKKSNVEGSTLEIALTGTALPVLVSVSPQLKYDFGECPVNEHVDQLCTLTNDSNNMAMTYQFRRVAHFTAHPPNGKIKPGQTQDIIFSFAPNQVGTFKPTQYIDIIGQVADNNNPFLLHLKVIHSIPLQFLGKSDPITVKKAPVFNPGITPKITNEVGMYIETTMNVSKKTPRAAMLNSQGTKLHRLKSSKDQANGDQKLVSFPNDRAGSIRPSNRKEQYTTIFTRTPRYTYIDPDYAYTDQEMKYIKINKRSTLTIFTHTDRHTYVDPDYSYTDPEAESVKRHKQYYVDFIKELREKRHIKQQNIEHREHDNDMDIAMKPAAGLKPRKITLEEVHPDPRPPTPPNSNFKLLSSKNLASMEATSAKKVKDGLNAVPVTPQEKKDCSKILSPQELHQIVIGPPTIDFGEVCLKSVSQKELNIVNNLEQYIHVNVQVDCRELRQTSPLSQVVPPKSKAYLPLIFESNSKGKFQRSLDYTINGFYKSHVTVFSEVVPPSLELSTDTLVLESQIGLPADAGIRGVITLHNKLNHPADFTWAPILGERGTAFSIRPATGTVEAFKDLDCEVVFHPSYLAPDDGQFHLRVMNDRSGNNNSHGSKKIKLKCEAKLGATNVQFIDRRIMFGQVPLHLTTTRTAMLKNTSLNHAYFQVMDPNPFPGLSVTPIHGVVPVGGTTEIKISLTPDAIIKFDTRVNVSIRGWKTLELRMGGTVEPPVVDIDMPSFNLGGVYCGSSSITPFRLINRAQTKGRVEFDLSRYSDFALTFPGSQTPEDYTFQLNNPGLYTVCTDADTTIQCELHFRPTEVASYDFIMPVSINQTTAPTPSPTPFPPTPAPSNKNSINHIINPRPVHVSIATPRKKIIATALRMPLQMSHNLLEFVLSPGLYEMSSASGIGQSKGTLLVNNSDRPVKWAVDLTKGNQVLEDGVFKFLHSSGMPYLTHGDQGVEGTLDPGQTQSLGVIFCPEKPGFYEVQLPLILNDDYEHPYQYITITGELKSPRLWFDPLAIVLTPVPLQTEISTEFQILASDYTKRATLTVEKLEVECEDGSKNCPVEVTFLDGQDIKPCCGDEGQQEPYILQCKVTFKSSRPVAFSQALKFMDDQGHSFSLPLTATADNCLMTCYPFLAQHRADHQIVCEQGHSLKGRKTASRESVSAGEAVLVPCDEPPRSQTRASTTETPSNFETSSSSYESSSQSVTVSGLGSSSASCGSSSCTFDTDSSGHHLSLIPQISSESLFNQAFQQYLTIPSSYFLLRHCEATVSGLGSSSASCGSSSCTFDTDSSGHHLSLIPQISSESLFNQAFQQYLTIPSSYFLLRHCEATESTFPSTPREGALNKFKTESAMDSRGRNDLASRSLGSALFPEEDTEEGIFHTEVLIAVQRWFSAQGWAGGPNPISIPENFRAGLTKKPNEEKARTSKGTTFEANNLKKEFKTVYDMINHLSGRHIPGIPINNPLPKEPSERVKQVYWQHQTLLTFMQTQGACVSSIKPEYLMEPKDYKLWVLLQKELDAMKHAGGMRDMKLKTEEEEAIEDQLLEAVSKRAWTDVLLQLLKTLLLAKITPKQFKSLPSPYKNQVPQVDPDPLCSNVYSVSERILLLWLNHNYERQRHDIWSDCKKGGVPPSRWVVNFDFDLLDGLVIAAALAAHVPFLVPKLTEMYSHPSSAEQCLHNALIVVNALRSIGIDYDIQAIDITDPNPISLMLLVVHLYHALPEYLPRNTVEFIGGLHDTVTRQVRLSNPSSKPLTYYAMITGNDARDFSLPKGDTIVINPKSTLHVSIQFKSRFLRPSEASIVFVGRRQGSGIGSTLVFTLTTVIDNITPKVTFKTESPCYELTRVPIEVTNPFDEAGSFRIVLVEAKNEFAGEKGASLMKKNKKKPKKIRSRIDTGRTKAESDEERDLSTQASSVRTTGEDSNVLSAFQSPVDCVYIEAGEVATVEINFLPFHTGKRQCSIIFINEKVGEFVYSIEAIATLPLPAELPFEPSAYGVRISSAAAAGGRGHGGDDRIVYWKCEVGQTLEETLTIPIVNKPREKALMTATMNHLSDTEIDRRRKTGTLTGEKMTSMAIDMLATDPEALKRTMSKEGALGAFRIEIDSKYFRTPAAITIPVGTNAVRTRSAPGNKRSKGKENTIEIPISFKAREPGHYAGQLVLKSQDDVRVFKIECTVTPEGSQAEIEFTAPVHEPVTQDIPIINETNHDWPMEAQIQGNGFVGPDRIVAKAYQKTLYPLLFRPQFEGQVEGLLVLRNTADSIDHKFTLIGEGQRPLPLDTIALTCKVKQSITQVVSVPNLTQKKLFYQTESDLSCVTGGDSLTVLPGQTGHYEVTISPIRRGIHKGVLAFVAGGNPIKDVDSDGEEVVDDKADELLRGYKIWYSIELNVLPGPPEKTLEITCNCQKKAVLEVGVTNPTIQTLTLNAEIKGQGLSGEPSITLPPKARGVYEVVYFPAIVGSYMGSLVLHNEQMGEFWYDLNLTALKPVASSLDHMECELGRWVRQNITLSNPTDETLDLIPMLSNTNNFSLERENDLPIQLRPHSTMKIPLTFMPSTLGSGDHNCKISFMCKQLGELEYHVTGSGTLPQPQDPVSVTAMAGSNTTLMIPFRNPLDIAVYADIYLIDKEKQTNKVLDEDVTLPQESPFCLLLKQNKALRLGPKSNIDVAVSFAPEDMRMFEATVKVVLTKEDRSSWVYVCTDENGKPVSRTNSGGLREIKWIYPIRGYPELTSTKEMTAALVQCKARARTEERLEVTLSGVAPSNGGPKRGIKARAVTPSGSKPKTPEGVVVGETINLADEFTYEVIYNDPDIKKDLDPCIGLNFVRSYRDKVSGLVVLVFNIVYVPSRQMRHDAELLVQGATGGLWRFPLRFVATEPDVDDTITIEAVGLNKESAVGIRLCTKDRHPAPYTAYMVAGSDCEFRVTPQSGELLPAGTAGTLIKVQFNPLKYGKIYRGKLAVQCGDMQWSYNVRGTLPDYKPPRGNSSRPIAGPHPDPRLRPIDGVKFIKDNLKLNTTAVSSPMKGAPLLRNKQDLSMY